MESEDTPSQIPHFGTPSPKKHLTFHSSPPSYPSPQAAAAENSSPGRDYMFTLPGACAQLSRDGEVLFVKLRRLRKLA